MKQFRIIILVAFVGITGLVLWQNARLKELTAESAVLRDQLAQAQARAEQPNSTAKAVSSSDQHVQESPSSELLRLRGQVAVLRHQLATEVASNAAKAVESAAQAQSTNQSALVTAEANLKRAQERAEIAKQKVSAIMAASNLPQGASDADAASSLPAAELMSYRQAKQESEELDRFVQVLRLKTAETRALNGQASQPGTAQ